MYVTQVVEQKGEMVIRSRGLVKTGAVIKNLKRKGIITLQVDLDKSSVAAPQNAEEEHSVPATPVPEPMTDGEALSEAHQLYRQSVTMQGRFLKSLKRGKPTSLATVASVSHNILDSVFHSPDAISCITQIKNADEYLLEHSINCSVLISLFAKQMQFDVELIEELAKAALLMDLGMTTMPQDIVKKKGALDASELSVIQTHPDAGVELIEHIDDVSDIVLDVVQNHQERVDGTGYPAGSSADQISTYAKMAAIVDTYDAMISNRPHKRSIPSTLALKRMLTNKGLDNALVQQFIKALGVHPVGSLVKLSSQKLAIVTRSNAEQPLKPVVTTFYSMTAAAYREIARIDLSKVNDSIVSSIRPEEFRINLGKFFFDVFMPSLE
jgi:HD-GYP domain-containing protein (c-di-GMP phosphodiesterase class II)